jgi:hypothetical protein
MLSIAFNLFKILYVIMLNVVMVSVVMLSVLAPAGQAIATLLYPHSLICRIIITLRIMLLNVTFQHKLHSAQGLSVFNIVMLSAIFFFLMRIIPQAYWMKKSTLGFKLLHCALL